MAVPGEDYRVVTSYDVRSLAAGTGRLVETVTPDGIVVYRDGPDGGSSASEIGLLDPTTGKPTPLPARSRGLVRTGSSLMTTSSRGRATGSPVRGCGSSTSHRRMGDVRHRRPRRGRGHRSRWQRAAVTRIQFAPIPPTDSSCRCDQPRRRSEARVLSVTLGGSWPVGGARAGRPRRSVVVGHGSRHAGLPPLQNCWPK